MTLNLRYRRQVHITPKSYLSFIAGYKNVCILKTEYFSDLCHKMERGVSKLEEASQSVQGMKQSLKKMEIDLEIANETAEKVLKEMSIRAQASESVRNIVEKAKIVSEGIVQEIQVEKALAEQKLEAAKPALREAETALNTIQPTHIATVRKLGRPPTLIMYIMDCVLILFQKCLPPHSRDPTKKFIKPSWDAALKFISTTGFLTALQNFPKDSINDEVIELLEPYFALKDYNMQTAKKVCGDVGGLLSWTKAMAFFFGINKEVLPLKSNLVIQENRLTSAMDELQRVENELQERESELSEVKSHYEEAMKNKEHLVNESKTCQVKILRATTLVVELSGEFTRWSEESIYLKERIKKLVGDVLIVTGFLSYTGAFNHSYRGLLIASWHEELQKREIPTRDTVDVINLLTTDVTISDWCLNGLPNDELSVQNGVLTTNALRYPLLIDPQGQGKAWIKNMESKNDIQVTSLNHKYFHRHVEESLSLGKVLLIEDIGEQIDPYLDNLLEKNFSKSGSSLKVILGDKECDVMPNFKLFITTKLANPNFSPEINAKTLVVDFTVTLQGLEEQLLGRVVLSEKSDLEKEKQNVTTEVVESRFSIENLEEDLLNHLTSTKGSLVDNETLITVLQNTKSTAQYLKTKLKIAAETQAKINKSREEFRSVATRGSILYFFMVEMGSINVMYQTSLNQFLQLFDESIEKSAYNSIVSRRVSNILDYLTFKIYKNVVRGCYKDDKLLFTLMLCLKLDLQSKKITKEEFLTFIKGGNSLDLSKIPVKSFSWITDFAWLNLNQLCKLPQFTSILNDISKDEKAWKKWYNSDFSELGDLPCDYSQRLNEFGVLLVIRSWCLDRTLGQAKIYIQASLGEQYVEDIVFDLNDLLKESNARMPLICLLSTTGDPSGQIENLAKCLSLNCVVVSMGQGQEVISRKALGDCLKTGKWLLLQNCHLSLDFCEEVLEFITDEVTTPHDNFRLWMTTEIHNKFPIGLLQISMKFTSEPPQGIKFGLKKIYNTFSEDVLNHSNSPQWKPMLFSIAFLNIVLQERKKFGALGWNVPYEFSHADFIATFKFLQKHFDDVDLKKGISWPTLHFMLEEVHYGGCITDDFDKRLLKTYCREWFTEALFQKNFNFHPSYGIPNAETVRDYLEYFNCLPSKDSAEVFGLHSNVEITYQMKAAEKVLHSIVNIPPKEDVMLLAGISEKSAYKMASDLLQALPEEFSKPKVLRRLHEIGKNEPMVIFLRQELDCMIKVQTTVRSAIKDLISAIEGSILMSEQLNDVMLAMHRSVTPSSWTKISWESSTLGFWLSELQQRVQQLNSWLFVCRPSAFWISGFFNPTAFLTAMKQEETRRHPGWTLDTVVQKSRITDFICPSDVPTHPKEGVYIYGLYLEGASWDLKLNSLREAVPKVLQSKLPIVHVFAANGHATPKGPMVYECPVYKKLGRSDSAYITTLELNTDEIASHWILRGVVLRTDIV